MYKYINRLDNFSIRLDNFSAVIVYYYTTAMIGVIKDVPMILVIIQGL